MIAWRTTSKRSNAEHAPKRKKLKLNAVRLSRTNIKMKLGDVIMSKVKATSFDGILESIHIEKFRKFKNLSFKFGKKITALVGQNGTMKTTLLGLIAQPFSMYCDQDDKSISSKERDYYKEKTLDGYEFVSKFAEKFKFDPDVEKAGEHKYTLYFKNDEIVSSQQFSIESIKRLDGQKETLRLWNSKGRERGDGYVHYPVIYLSLKRVFPIGEEKGMDLLPKNTFYNSEFQSLAREILISTENYDQTDFIKSTNKATLVAHPVSYGATTISAGQDNIGKILTAILSFKMLHEKYQGIYKGGLLFIDELDVTLYPAAQKKLLGKLLRFASDYKIQVIFTTHSPTIINELYQNKFVHDSKIIFLKETSGQVICEENLRMEQIEAKLDVSVVQKPLSQPKIRVYTEDEQARIFFKTLLPTKYKNKLEILNIAIGGNELKELVASRKIPEFMDNLIVLDGDKKLDTQHHNIILLPGCNDKNVHPASFAGPDRLIYEFLNELSDDDIFWPGVKVTGAYDKQICFKTFPTIKSTDTQSRESYKQWFLEQEVHWGKQKNLPFKYWIEKNKIQANDFTKKFIKAYNYLAKRNKLDIIN